jgi:hypothetical protein
MRYFLIFYTGPLKGSMVIKQEKYPNIQQWESLIATYRKDDLAGRIGYEDFTITNIIELSEQDYNDAIQQ